MKSIPFCPTDVIHSRIEIQNHRSTKRAFMTHQQTHHLGGYQTWTGLHSYAEPGTGERMADEVVGMIEEIQSGH